MSGILDSKSRVLDTIVTTEGKRQLARGGLDVRYVTFSDGGTFYKADVASGSQDATKRIYLESCQLPQDDISFQADDDGNVTTFRNSDGVQVSGGRIIDYSFSSVSSSVITGSLQTSNTLTGSSFLNAAETLLAASFDNFSKLRVVATKDNIFEDDGFGAGPNNVTFAINNDRPISDPNQFMTHVGSLDSVFSDPRFSNLPNFKYLPPVNKITDTALNKKVFKTISSDALGNYKPLGRTQAFGLTYAQTMSELAYYQSLGYMKVISFDPTSGDNRLVGQFFEKSFSSLRKLDIIDFGQFNTGNASAPVAHIFFVGKVEVDEKGTDTFLHLFTLVFE